MASITKNSGRQSVLSAIVTIPYSEISAAGAFDIVDLPIGAIVTRGAIIADTFISGGTVSACTMSIGDSGSATRYATTANIFTGGTAYTALTLTGYQHTSSTNTLKATMAYTGATPSAGSIKVVVDYIVNGRAETSCG